MPLDVTHNSIDSYIKNLPENRRTDVLWLVEKMEKISKRKPKLWGSIIGFGRLYYRYPTGNDGYMPIIALSSRKQALTLYLSFNLEKEVELKNLGTYKIGKSCLYIKKLSDIHLKVLLTIIKKAYLQSLAYDFIKVIE
ncbi:MAG: DUF1801 domain-containing protein [Bacilli bacterium]